MLEFAPQGAYINKTNNVELASGNLWSLSSHPPTKLGLTLKLSRRIVRRPNLTQLKQTWPGLRCTARIVLSFKGAKVFLRSAAEHPQSLQLHTHSWSRPISRKPGVSCRMGGSVTIIWIVLSGKGNKGHRRWYLTAHIIDFRKHSSEKLKGTRRKYI